jgi:hypothetical protein
MGFILLSQWLFFIAFMVFTFILKRDICDPTSHPKLNLTLCQTKYIEDSKLLYFKTSITVTAAKHFYHHHHHHHHVYVEHPYS